MKKFLNRNQYGAEKTVFCADIGTSSLKAALITKSGLVAAFSQQHFTSEKSTKIANDWITAFLNAAKDFGEKINTVEGICISGNGPTIVGEDGTTLLWNDEIPENCTGANLKTKSLFIPRIKSFKTLFPNIWNASKNIFSGPEFLIYKLCGNAISILPEKRYSIAYWTDEELAKYEIESKKLPQFVAPAFCAGSTLPEITKQMGLTEDVPVFCGAPDFIVALIGTNTLTPGKICDCAGSSEGLNLCTSEPIDSAKYAGKIRTLPSVVPGLWNAGVLFTSSGKRFNEYKKTFELQTGKSVSYNELTENCVKDKTGEGYKIMFELAQNLADGYQLLKKAATDANLPIAEKIQITGGQAKSPSWVQMKADVAKVPFAAFSITDSELLGDAVLAYIGLGTYKNIQEAAENLVKENRIYYPLENHS